MGKEWIRVEFGAGGRVEFGVAFVDTSIGSFQLGQFEDDRYRSRLSTLLTRYNPVEIILAKRGVSNDTTQLWNATCPNALHEVGQLQWRVLGSSEDPPLSSRK
jgi:DNA mismatch repair protein MSH6